MVVYHSVLVSNPIGCDTLYIFCLQPLTALTKLAKTRILREKVALIQLEDPPGITIDNSIQWAAHYDPEWLV